MKVLRCCLVSFVANGKSLMTTSAVTSSEIGSDSVQICIYHPSTAMRSHVKSFVFSFALKYSSPVG